MRNTLGIFRSFAREQLILEASPRLLLAGPAGAGKSSIARLLETRFHLARIETDRLPRLDARTGGHLSLSTYDFAAFVGPHLPPPPAGVVLDVGCDSVFRVGSDNSARESQVGSLKTTAGLTVVLVSAAKEVVRERYLTCGKPSSPACFDAAWDEWREHMEPRWLAVADRMVNVAGDLDDDLLLRVAFG